jgi:regulator of replication initiation timing
MESLLEENKALKTEVERLRGVIRSYLEWRNPNLDDCESEEFHVALSALRAAAEEPKP